ncbi:MAG: hypothetical protein U9P88_00625 [Patescibacteria group bacterium]|nr:hypothetical protein [Patescibacteria group bacterium]
MDIFQAITLFFSAFSLLGVVIILTKKAPYLIELPKIVEEYPRNESFSDEKIKRVFGFISFSSDVFLQKILSKIKVLALKIENKTQAELEKSRKKLRVKNIDSDYWKNIKKSTKDK